MAGFTEADEANNRRVLYLILVLGTKLQQLQSQMLNHGAKIEPDDAKAVNYSAIALLISTGTGQGGPAAAWQEWERRF